MLAAMCVSTEPCFVNRAHYCQKSPVFCQKSPAFCQNCPSLSMPAAVCVSTEPYIVKRALHSVKIALLLRCQQPFACQQSPILSKEPYILSKEPYILSKLPFSLDASGRVRVNKALCIVKRALYSVKIALLPRCQRPCACQYGPTFCQKGPIFCQKSF